VNERAVEVFQRLRMLRALAFLFARTRDNSGEVVALVGVRMHHGVVDVIQIYGEDDADAVRIPTAELNGETPGTVLWSTSGPPAEVIDAMLDLPDPAGHSWISASRNGNSGSKQHHPGFTQMP